MKRIIFFLIAVMTLGTTFAVDMNARKERKAIVAGNEAYRAKKYSAALNEYENALKINPSNLTALFNKGLALTQQAYSLKDEKAEEKGKMLEQASKIFESVAKHTSDNPQLAERAAYNRGNISMTDKKYEEAIDWYKSALRLNPNDNQARKNLRIAQQNMPKQQQNQNKDQNQDKNKDQDKNQDQDQNKDKNNNKDQNQNKDQDKDKDQNKDKNKDQNQDKNQQQQQKQDMNNQAADRILKHSADKENQTRKNFMIGNPAGGRRKGW